MKGLTQAEFAKRAGCSQTLVSTAVRTGRLALLPDGGIDPALLKSHWRANPKLSQKRAAADSGAIGTPAKKAGRPKAKPTDTKAAKANAAQAASFAAATLEKEQSLAALRRLEYEQRAGLLIAVETAQRVLFEQARSARDHWLNWPSRAAPTLAAELGVEPDAVMRVLTKLVHRHMSVWKEPDGADLRSDEG
jgi:transcriptional regulator with XRE-family HTH domain